MLLFVLVCLMKSSEKWKKLKKLLSRKSELEIGWYSLSCKPSNPGDRQASLQRPAAEKTLKTKFLQNIKKYFNTSNLRKETGLCFMEDMKLRRGIV